MMTVHVLHAGDGYTYLTRQVAAGDNVVRSGEDLTAYYNADGNPAGQWLGSGLVNLGVSGTVSEEQMKALFGEGLHPDAEQIISNAIAGGASPEEAVQVARLGRRFPRIKGVADGWDEAVADAYAEFAVTNGRSPEVGVERDLIRWNIAADRVAVKLKRPGTDAEVATHLSQVGKAPRQPVAGYDLVFTPVKSVSVLWALGDQDTSEKVREAHNAAWQATVAWLETQAGVTRVGAGGVAQVDTHGFVATAFEHHDSRTGDPNLHTHVAVSTKVQGLDGKWRSLDGRVLHALGVASSERYNTLIEQEMRNRLGVTFMDESRGRSKRSVREIVGISQELRDSFSSRRVAIEDSYETLVQEYVAKHGHTPPKAVQLSLAQRATLETREGKGELKSLTEQRAEWRLAAVEIVGERAVDEIGTTVQQRRELSAEDQILAASSVDELADRVLLTVEDSRSTWRRSHVAAEAQRIARSFTNVSPGAEAQQIADSVSQAVMARVIAITAPALNPAPAALQRQDGESVYRVHGTERFTSVRILAIEDSLVDAARTVAGFTVKPAIFDATVEKLNAASPYPLDASQVELARRFASGGRLLEVGIGPAGTGKTTAMRAFARAVEAGGGRVLALAPTAGASTVLAEEINVEADTAHKLVHVHKNGSLKQQQSDQYRIDSNTVLLIDEAGMASTPLLADVLELAQRHGATIRLLGDPAQLAAVESGGALRLIEQRVGASYLNQVHRFVDKEEAAASLLLREGESRSLDFYVTADRTRGGTRESMLDEIYVAWAADRTANLHSIMVAGTNVEVAALNARARLDLIDQGFVGRSGALLHDGNKAGLNDVIVTRKNDRMLRSNQGRDFVTNGDLWTVMGHEGDGLKVKSLRHGGVLTLPAEYVARDVELGYAATINRVQGMTVDTSHILVDPQSTSREQLYVAATRGREANRMYAVVEETLDVDLHAPDHLRTSIVDALTSVLAREGAELSATEEIQREQDAAASLSTLLPAYEDALTRVYEPDQIETPVWSATGTALPSWVTPPPPLGQGDNRDLQEWLRTQAGLIEGRVDALVAANALSPEPWTAKLGFEPGDEAQQREWRRDLRDVFAYRDLHHIVDSESPLGAARDDDAYRAAASSLEHLSTDQVGPPELPTEPTQPELDALPENPATRQGAATQTLVAPRVVPAVALAPVAAPAPVVAQPVTAAQPTKLTRPKKRTTPHEVRRIDGFDATSADSVELLAVVQETPAGLIYADYQINAASIQGQGQQGLHLKAEKSTRTNDDGTERRVTSVHRQLTRDQYDRIKDVAGNDRLELDDGRIVYNFAVDVEVDPQHADQFRPKLKSMQSSALAAPTEKTLAKQRASEAKARNTAAEAIEKPVKTTIKTPDKKPAPKAALKPSERLAALIRSNSEKGQDNSLGR